VSTDIAQLEKSVFVSVEVCIFTIKDNNLKVLLNRSGASSDGEVWALPGDFLKKEESLEEASLRVLREKGGVFENLYLEQLYTYGEAVGDPGGRVITVAYFALVYPGKSEIRENAAWHSVYELPPLALGQGRIIRYAHQRLKYKLEYTAIALEILPKFFTLTELQRVYEVVLGEKLDKRNFRKKIFSMGIVKPTEKYKFGVHRPARLYTFKKNNKRKKIPGFRWTKLEM
jgi:8-oxo-dGTP diphosphatase